MTMRSIASRLDRLEQQIGKRDDTQYVVTMLSGASSEENAAAVRNIGFDPDAENIELRVINVVIHSVDGTERPYNPVPKISSVVDTKTKRQVWPT